MIDWIISATRLLQYTSALVLFGSALFSIYATAADEAPVRIGDTERAGFRSSLLPAAVVGLASTLVWLSAEAASLTGAWTAVGTLLTDTRFGPITTLRAALFALAFLACLILRPAKTLAIAVSILGGVIVASFAWTGHGAMNTGFARLLHLSADVFHLLAAGIWVGALLPLSVLITRCYRNGTPTQAWQLAHGLARFSVIGPAVVGLLTLTGLVNAWYLIGITHWTALFDTRYGLLLLAKLVLVAGMLALAAINRWRLTPRLEETLADSARTTDSVRALGSSVLTESALALLVLAIVAVLGTLEPPVSVE